MKRRASAIGLVICMVLVMLTGCGEKRTDGTEAGSRETDAAGAGEMGKEISLNPLDMITEGYYSYGYTAEGYGDYVYYFRFYEEDPVLGAVFYAGFANNGINFAGTYKVEEASTDYFCAADRAELLKENKLTGTAPYTICFYDWAGNEIDRCGFDGNILYNDMENLAGMGGGEVYYNHDTAGESSEYASAYSGELGVSYLEFEAANDSTSTLSLFHNRTYVDLMGTIIEGSWSIAANAQGGYDYTLVPADSSDTGAVVSVSEDQRTASYQPEGAGEVIEMANAAAALTAVGQFTGTWFLESANTDISLTLTLYDDMSCELVADAFGKKMTLDAGDYEQTADGYQFTLDGAGALGTIQEGDGVAFQYRGATQIGEMDAVLTLDPDSVQAGETALAQQ